jgi:hypothetical protein
MDRQRKIAEERKRRDQQAMLEKQRSLAGARGSIRNAELIPPCCLEIYAQYVSPAGPEPFDSNLHIFELKIVGSLVPQFAADTTTEMDRRGQR